MLIFLVLIKIDVIIYAYWDFPSNNLIFVFYFYSVFNFLKIFGLLIMMSKYNVNIKDLINLSYVNFKNYFYYNNGLNIKHIPNNIIIYTI